MVADAGRTPYDKPEPAVLHFDRLDGGEIVALHTAGGRTVAAVIAAVCGPRGIRWSLAGDVDPAARPQGYAAITRTACAEAADALGRELGIEIAGWTVTS